MGIFNYKNKAKYIVGIFLVGTLFFNNITSAYAFPGAKFIAKKAVIVLAEIVGQTLIEELVKDAYKQHTQGNNGLSINLWSKAIKESDTKKIKSASLYFNRGLAYAAEGNAQQAIVDYNKAIELNPEYSDAYNNRGIAYAMLGNNEQATKDFSKAIELSPSDGDVYNNRGYAFSKEAEDINNSIEYITTHPEDRSYAIMNPENGSERADIKVIVSKYSKLKDEKYQNAIEDFTKAIKNNPDNYQAYYHRAEIFKAMGKAIEAENDYNKANELRANQK